jgi:hypothetical protein
MGKSTASAMATRGKVDTGELPVHAATAMSSKSAVCTGSAIKITITQ